MSDEPPKLCQNCRRDIPSTNFEMHIVHCQRNIRLCPKCDEPVPHSEMANHEVEFHTNVKCPECNHKFESSKLSQHKENECSKRIQPCQYCNLELKADEILAHEDYCGSRTECCEECGKLVMLKFQQMHLTSDHKLMRPDEDPSSESDDDNCLVDVEEHYSHLMNRDHQLNPPSSRRGHSFRDRERINQFGEDLDEYFQNMELDHIRNTSAAKINELTETNAAYHPTGAAAWEHDTYIPCEFCQVPIPATDLILHQTGCRPDLSSYVSAKPSKKPSQMEQGNAMNEYLESRHEPDHLEKTDDVIIPCEFCKKPFHWDFVHSHQLTCGNDFDHRSRRGIPDY